MIAAAVLTKEEVVLEGCPKISDVEDMAEIVRSLGGTVWWERNALHLNCEKDRKKSRVEGALSKRLRASLLFLGSLLARTGEAYLAGGRRLPDRKAADGPASEGNGASGSRGLRGGRHHSGKGRSSERSRALLSEKKECRGDGKCGSFAVGAEGATRLEHCAREPEVVHLCRFLKAMGAEITGEGRSRLPFTEGRERDCCPAAGIVFRVTGSRQGRIF